MRLNIVLVLFTVLLGFALTLWFDKQDSSTSVPLAPVAPVVASANQVGQMAPDFTVVDIKGRTHKLADARGRFVVLHFWATWCTPCVLEFPKLMAFAKDHPEVQVFALSSDTNDAAVDRFLRKNPAIPPNMVVARDHHQKITADLFQTFKLPESFLLDKSGQIFQKITGDADWQSPEIRQFFK